MESTKNHIHNSVTGSSAAGGKSVSVNPYT